MVINLEYLMTSSKVEISDLKIQNASSEAINMWNYLRRMNKQLLSRLCNCQREINYE